MKDEILLTRKQTAEILSVKPDTVRKWHKANILKPSCLLNGRPRYRLVDLNHLLTSKPVNNVK